VPARSPTLISTIVAHNGYGAPNVTRALVADVVDASSVDGPGNRYVVFLQGCTFNCLTCHNPQTIACQQTAESRWIDVDDLHADIARKARYLSGVTVSGGEATIQWQAVDELFRRLATSPETAGLTRLVDSNGDADAGVWEVLAISMHGAMIDMKALDPDVHVALTGRANTRVLASLRQLTRLGRLAEVRLLIVPGVNDEREQLVNTARWLATLDPVPPVTVLGFRRDGTRSIARDFEEPSRGELATVAATLVEHGLPAARVTIRGAKRAAEAAR
jgi:pyruvate-formate lyase-activating enzyme